MPTLKHFLFLVVFIAWCSCNQSPSPNTAHNAADTMCRLQIQDIKTLLGGKYKTVSAQRYCDGQYTREVLLFAQHEPINNDKKCNVFATTDTTVQWRVKLEGNRIDILFEQHKPDETTILLQQETVYDSIEVVYSVINAAEG